MIALAGNKCDLVDQRTISVSSAQHYAKDNDLIFMEISAKTGHKVFDVFLAIAQHLIEQIQLNA